MIFSKNTTNISLVEAELKHLKSIYTKALGQSDDSTLKQLRKAIKLLSARLATISLQPAQ